MANRSKAGLVSSNTIKSPVPNQASQSQTRANYFLYFVIGTGVSSIWTLLGWVIAFLNHDGWSFLQEWFLLQGPPLLCLGIFLLLIIKSHSFEGRVQRLTQNGSIPAPLIAKRTWRWTLVLMIGIVGTASLVGMGFHSNGWVRFFMWATCTLIDIAAGIVTLHIIDVLSIIHRLREQPIKASRYAPANTKELKDVVNYFTSLTLLVTIGYGLSLLGTVKGHWEGNAQYIRVVQLFWPVLYVPLCSIALVYPHLVIHRIIKREKEVTLSSYKREIDEHLVDYSKMKNGEVQQLNALVQLFDRVSSTPNYVIDLGTTVRTVLPLAFNVLTLLSRIKAH